MVLLTSLIKSKNIPSILWDCLCFISSSLVLPPSFSLSCFLALAGPSSAVSLRSRDGEHSCLTPGLAG